jgi:hypothetical protein
LTVEALHFKRVGVAMLSRQEEEQERRAVLENDRRVREQQQQNASTFHQHAQAQADELSQGRFRAIGTPRVIGATPNPSSQYPAASAAHQTSLPPEQPLGCSVDAMPGDEPLEVPSFAQGQLGGAADAPSAAPDVEHAAPPLFFGANE